MYSPAPLRNFFGSTNIQNGWLDTSNLYVNVRTSFDLDPTQEWIQAHVAQTMNL